MQTKLTLRLEETLIEKAKIIAKQQDKSLSQIVSDYFQMLARKAQNSNIPPITQSLIGTLESQDVDIKDYKKHLEDKYLLKVLFDTNVVLDVLLNREQLVEKSALLMGMVENKKIEGYLCATTVTTLDYLISKALNTAQAKIGVQKLLSLFQIAEVNSTVLGLSINSGFGDFEDAVQYYSGVCCNVDCLVTRNIKDYKNAEEYPVYMPDELIGIIAINEI